MMIEEKFKLIEAAFIRLFQAAAERINKDFRNLFCSVYVHSPQDEPDLNHYSLGLEVVLHHAAGDNSDNLCLELDVLRTARSL